MRRLEAGLYAAAAVLLAVTVYLHVGGNRDEATRRSAEAGLDALQAAEHGRLATHKPFAPFGPTAAEMAAALPGVDVPQAADFAFDALPDASGVLHLRAVTRPDAVAGGRVTPLLLGRDIAGPPLAAPAGTR